LNLNIYRTDLIQKNQVEMKDVKNQLQEYKDYPIDGVQENV